MANQRYDVLLTVQYDYDPNNTYYEVVTYEAADENQALGYARRSKAKKRLVVAQNASVCVIKYAQPAGNFDHLIGRRVGYSMLDFL